MAPGYRFAGGFLFAVGLLPLARDLALQIGLGVRKLLVETGEGDAGLAGAAEPGERDAKASQGPRRARGGGELLIGLAIELSPLVIARRGAARGHVVLRRLRLGVRHVPRGG